MKQTRRLANDQVRHAPILQPALLRKLCRNAELMLTTSLNLARDTTPPRSPVRSNLSVVARPSLTSSCAQHHLHLSSSSTSSHTRRHHHHNNPTLKLLHPSPNPSIVAKHNPHSSLAPNPPLKKRRNLFFTRNSNLPSLQHPPPPPCSPSDFIPPLFDDNQHGPGCLLLCSAQQHSRLRPPSPSHHAMLLI